MSPTRRALKTISRRERVYFIQKLAGVGAAEDGGFRSDSLAHSNNGLQRHHWIRASIIPGDMCLIPDLIEVAPLVSVLCPVV